MIYPVNIELWIDRGVFYLFIYLIYLFIYFWLRWVFVAMHRLSLVATSGAYSSL